MEHLGRLPDDGSQPDVLATMADCVDPQGMFDDLRRLGPGPRRLAPRRAQRPSAARATCAACRDPSSATWRPRAVRGLLERLHDPDGRPAPLQRRHDY